MRVFEDALKLPKGGPAYSHGVKFELYSSLTGSKQPLLAEKTSKKRQPVTFNLINKSDRNVFNINL